MLIVKCKNNHFVDGDKYSVCPQCGAALGDLDNKKSSGNQSKVTVSQQISTPSIPGEQYTEEYGTMSIWEANKRTAQEAVSPEPEIVPEDDMEESREEVQDVIQKPAVSSNSLQQEILNASADNSGKTVGIWMGAQQETSGKAVSQSHKNRLVPDDYIAGWLVCVGGPHYHECFAVCYGRNAIGRGADNDICLELDSSVSREEQGWILYDNLNRKFYIESGHTKVPIYVNDEILLSNSQLQDNSIISIGNTKLVFIPLCGDNFDWKDYPEK